MREGPFVLLYRCSQGVAWFVPLGWDDRHQWLTKRQIVRHKLALSNRSISGRLDVSTTRSSGTTVLRHQITVGDEGGISVTAERYDSAIDEVARTARQVCEALQTWNDELGETRRLRDAGVPFLEMLQRRIAQGSRDRRVGADEAIAAYRNAVRQLRVAAVRTLVDDEGMTLTAVARLLRISRQMTSRLYRGD